MFFLQAPIIPWSYHGRPVFVIFLEDTVIQFFSWFCWMWDKSKTHNIKSHKVSSLLKSLPHLFHIFD